MGLLSTVSQLFGRAEPQKPDGGYLISLGNTTSGVPIYSVEQALSFTAVWACVRVVTESIAGLPWRVSQRIDGGKRKPLDKHPVTTLLHKRPNAEMGAFAWREEMIKCALLWGDGYSEIERDLAGRPMGLWPIEPYRMTITRDANGNLVYEVRNEGRGPTYLDAADVFHVHGLGPTGLCGYYVVAMFREAIGLGLATQAQAASFFGNAGMPSGFLTHPGMITEAKAQELITRFEGRHQGPSKRGRIGLLRGGLTFAPVATTNEDAELDKTRTFQILEACRIFRVPPHKVAELSRATFSNIAEQETAFGRDTLAPWAQRLEQEADAKLFPPWNQGYYTKINVDAIMRGDPKSRAEFYEIMERIGAISPNEIRAKEDWDPIGSDGDQYLVPANFTTLERLADPPEPPAPPPQFGVVDTEEDAGKEDTEEDVKDEKAAASHKRAIYLLVRDLTGWIGRRATKETEEASRRCCMGLPVADRDQYSAWLESYRDRSAELIGTRLGPLVEAWAELDGVDLDPLADEAIDCGKRVAAIVGSLAAGGYVDGLFGPVWADLTAEGIMKAIELRGQTNGETE